MSLKEAGEMLTAPGSKFEMETVTIRGVPTRVWKNAPHDLGQLLDLSRTHGGRTFTVLDDERVTYEANYRATATLARALQDMGVGKGDRVAFAMRNLPEWPVVFFAITTIGAIAVPLNAWWTGAELEYG
ncbi:MAG: AMP-binding protein, partial [Proteobacteria bacterium]|nr:AMP-binding protein [Pseudomonadota bacterium]